MRSRRCATRTSRWSSAAPACTEPAFAERRAYSRRRRRLLRPRRADFDLVIVGYPGHFDVPQARRLARRKPLVFDAVLSLEDELVVVRRRFRPRSTAATVLRAVDTARAPASGSRRLRDRRRVPLPPVARRGERRVGLPRHGRGAVPPPVDADLSVHGTCTSQRGSPATNRPTSCGRPQSSPTSRRASSSAARLRPTTWESRSRTPGSCSGAFASRGRSRPPSSTGSRPERR